MAVEVADIPVQNIQRTETYEELLRKLQLLTELHNATKRDLIALEARITALEP